MYEERTVMNDSCIKVKLTADSFRGICARRYAKCVLLLTIYFIIILITSATEHYKFNLQVQHVFMCLQNQVCL